MDLVLFGMRVAEYAQKFTSRDAEGRAEDLGYVRDMADVLVVTLNQLIDKKIEAALGLDDTDLDTGD